MVAGPHGNLTKWWKQVGRLRESISDEEINALETIANDVVAWGVPPIPTDRKTRPRLGRPCRRPLGGPATERNPGA